MRIGNPSGFPTYLSPHYRGLLFTVCTTAPLSFPLPCEDTTYALSNQTSDKLLSKFRLVPNSMTYTNIVVQLLTDRAVRKAMRADTTASSHLFSKYFPIIYQVVANKDSSE